MNSTFKLDNGGLRTRPARVETLALIQMLKGHCADQAAQGSLHIPNSQAYMAGKPRPQLVEDLPEKK